MYTLTGQKIESDGGCLFVGGGLLLLTLASLSAFLLPSISSAEWYLGLVYTTFSLLIFALMVFFASFSDKRTKYLLSFIVVSCLLLQTSLLQPVFQWPDNILLPATWDGPLHIGCALFLVGLFLFTVIAHQRKVSSIGQNIENFSLAISKQRVTIGKPFLIRYTLSSKQVTLINSISITFSYQQFVNAYQQPYKEYTLPVYQKKDCISDPTKPLIEEFWWTIPTYLVPENVPRQDWCLKMQTTLHKGFTIRSKYPLKVMWVWPEGN